MYEYVVQRTYPLSGALGGSLEWRGGLDGELWAVSYLNVIEKNSGDERPQRTSISSISLVQWASPLPCTLRIIGLTIVPVKHTSGHAILAPRWRVVYPPQSLGAFDAISATE